MKPKARHRPSRKMGLRCELKIASRSARLVESRRKPESRRRAESRKIGGRRKPENRSDRPSRRMDRPTKVGGFPAGRSRRERRLAKPERSLTGAELKEFSFDVRRRSADGNAKGCRSPRRVGVGRRRKPEDAATNWPASYHDVKTPGASASGVFIYMYAAGM